MKMCLILATPKLKSIQHALFQCFLLRVGGIIFEVLGETSFQGWFSRIK